MDSPAERQLAQAYWRRQLVLSGLAVVALALAVGATRLVLADWGRDPANRALVVILVGLTAVAACVLLGALVLHTYRVALFAFRRGERQ